MTDVRSRNLSAVNCSMCGWHAFSGPIVLYVALLRQYFVNVAVHFFRTGLKLKASSRVVAIFTLRVLSEQLPIGCSRLSHQIESCSLISNVISGWSQDLWRKWENTASIGHRESLKCKTCLYRGILGGQLADTRYRSVTCSSRSPSDVRVREQKSRNARTLNCYVEKLVNVEKLLLANRNSTVHSMYMKRSGWLSFPAFCRISPAACAF